MNALLISSLIALLLQVPPEFETERAALIARKKALNSGRGNAHEIEKKLKGVDADIRALDARIADIKTRTSYNAPASTNRERVGVQISSVFIPATNSVRTNAVATNAPSVKR